MLDVTHKALLNIAFFIDNCNQHLLLSSDVLDIIKGCLNSHNGIKTILEI